MEKHKQWMLVVEIGFTDKVTKEEAGRRLNELVESSSNLFIWDTTGFMVHPDYKSDSD